MTISATGWEARCNHPEGCRTTLSNDNMFRLYDEMQRLRWQRDVKLNGDHAIRGGKDYCPAHRRGSDV